jgi:hypothetical protein
MKPGSWSKTDPRKLMRLACCDAEDVSGLLITANVPNAPEQEELVRFGCVFLGSPLSTVNRVKVQRQALSGVLSLGYVLDFDPFEAHE